MPEPHNGRVEEWCQFVEQRLQSADLWFGHGTDNAWDEAVWLVSHCLTLPTPSAGQPLDPLSLDLATVMALDTEAPDFPGRLVTDKQQQDITTLLERRITTRQPLAYLTNIAWFVGLPFFVDERVIIPRAHIGEWIADGFYPWIDSDRPVNKILDIGTGSGCIAIALALAFENALVHATDLDADALAVAEINARLHGVSNRVTFIQADVFPPTRDEAHQYDIICSNPPYVEESTYSAMPAEYLHEPRLAFVAKKEGTQIANTILKRAPEYLRAKGVVFMEVGTARPALEQRYPQLPLTWLASSEEEDVILMIDEDTLKSHQSAFE